MITAKLEIEGKTFNILNFSFDFEQNSSYNGYPSSTPTGGLFKIVIESTQEKLFFEWMSKENSMKNAKIIISPSFAMGKSRVIELIDGYLIKYLENFDGINNRPISTYMELSPAIMLQDGVKIFEKYWKVTDLSNNVAPTKIEESTIKTTAKLG